MLRVDHALLQEFCTGIAAGSCICYCCRWCTIKQCELIKVTSLVLHVAQVKCILLSHSLCIVARATIGHPFVDCSVVLCIKPPCSNPLPPLTGTVLPSLPRLVCASHIQSCSVVTCSTNLHLLKLLNTYHYDKYHRRPTPMLFMLVHAVVVGSVFIYTKHAFFHLESTYKIPGHGVLRMLKKLAAMSMLS